MAPFETRNRGLSPTKVALALPFAAAAGWIAYSRFAVDHAVPLPLAIGVEVQAFPTENAGRLAYYARSGSGRPLVLLHGINAAASSYEMRPLFEYYSHTRPVYALDLPGFGYSERVDRPYSPQLYQDTILGFLESVVGEPADVVALSLSSEFAARAALLRPDRFHSLTLISPTGFSARAPASSSEPGRLNETSDFSYSVFSFPLWALAFYDLLVTRPSIHYFLSRSFEGHVDQGLEDYAYITSHQPGARFAPLSFVSGKLFTRDVRTEVYERLTVPALVLYDRDGFVRFDTLPDLVERRTNWRCERIVPTRGLPQFDKLPETVAALDAFWQSELVAQRSR